MNQPDKHINSTPLARDARFAFVMSSWHSEIVERALQGFLAALPDDGSRERNVDVFTVPGAFEIPLHAKRLAKSQRYAGIVAAAFVVDGGIYRHDFVASAVIDGLMQVQLETDVPVFSLVLTPHHFHAHSEHQSFFLKHFLEKGKEAAHAALATVESFRRLDPR